MGPEIKPTIDAGLLLMFAAPVILSGLMGLALYANTRELRQSKGKGDFLKKPIRVIKTKIGK